MFKHMNPVRGEQFSVNGSTYTLSLYRISEAEDRFLFVSKNGKGVGHSFFASSDAVIDARKQSGMDIEQLLFEQAKNDIERNEYSEY